DASKFRVVDRETDSTPRGGGAVTALASRGATALAAQPVVARRGEAQPLNRIEALTTTVPAPEPVRLGFSRSETVGTSALVAKKGALSVIFFDSAVGEVPAYVDFRPGAMDLHVDREIWQLAKDGQPEARTILAHEIGHLVLHDHGAKEYSRSTGSRSHFGAN